MNDFAIEIKGLTITFGTHIALDNISFNVPQNSFVSVVGPNGGGKSTLIKVLLGLINPTSGDVKIFNEKPSNIPGNIIGYVPQIKTLDRSFPAMPIELVATGITGTWPGIMNRDNKKMALEALELVGSSHVAKRPLSKLSGGELQRIYLARSLVRKPKLLLLDEPAAGIDLISEKDLSKLIDDYQNEYKATVIMVTHDWESAYHHADHVILLNRVLVCYDIPEKAFAEANLRLAFGHLGHKHEMIFVVKK